jgi:hypothetical protein
VTPLIPFTTNSPSIEIILLIVCGSIPALRPLYLIYMGRNPLSVDTTHRSQGTGYGKSRRSRTHRPGLGSSVALVDVPGPVPSHVMVTSDQHSDAEWGYAGSEKGHGIYVKTTVTVE